MVLLGDQTSKAWVSSSLGKGRSISTPGGLLYLEFTRNTGAAFGILPSRGVLFAVVAVVTSITIFIYFKRVTNSSLLVRAALGLVLGGALGNLLDRVRLGYVVDFLDLRWWPVFNIADSAIVVGVCLLILEMSRRPERRAGE